MSLGASATAWTSDNPAGAALTQAALDAMLGDLEALRISGEWGGQVEETVGLDEVKLHGLL